MREVLVVTNDFPGHAKGDHIIDAEEMQKILDSEFQANVVKTLMPDPADPK